MFNQVVQLCQYTSIILVCLGFGFKSYIFAILDKGTSKKDSVLENEANYLVIYTILNLVLLFLLPITLLLSEINIVNSHENGFDLMVTIETIKTSVPLWLTMVGFVLHLLFMSKPFMKKVHDLNKINGYHDE